MTEDSDKPISHLQRRKIEARVLIPFIETCRDRLGKEATREIVTETIRRLAADDGISWADAHGSSLAALRRVAEDVWGSGANDHGWRETLRLSISQENVSRLSRSSEIASRESQD